MDHRSVVSAATPGVNGAPISEVARTFRFVDDALNRRLIAELERRKVRCRAGNDGTVHFSDADIDIVENEIVSSLRGRIYPRWQVLTCPTEWIETYRNYMLKKNIPFVEELSDGELWFLVPAKFRSDRWKLNPPHA